MARLWRILLVWLSLVGPWLALSSAGQQWRDPTGSPSEERETAEEEIDGTAVIGVRRQASQRGRPRHFHLPIQSSAQRRLVLAKVRVPEAATRYHKPVPRVLIRRVPPPDEEPIS